MSPRRNRLLLFAILFSSAIALDLVKFLVLGKPTVVNWESLVHSLWVILASGSLFLSVFFLSARRLAFWIYLTIFLASYINIYFSFTETLTYFCMIFNLILTSIYFFTLEDPVDTQGTDEKTFQNS